MKRLLLTLVIGFFSAMPALAALNTGIEEGGAFQTALGLGTGDIKIIIANIIRIVLGLLGVIAVSLVVYGGFLWMTSAGNEERTQKARQVLINAGIGLIIVLLSYIIVAYVLGKLLGATQGGTDLSDGASSSSGVPTSTSSVFVVESVSPQGTQTIKNLTVRLTFNRDVDDTTAEDNITITPTAGGEAVAGTYTVSGDRVSFKPSSLCYGYDDEYCFDSDTGYTVSLGSGLKSSDGLTISCGGLYDSCDYTFTSGSLVDTTDPEVAISYPEDGDSISVNSTVPLQATVTDDGGVSLVEFYVDGELIDTVQPDGDTPLSYSAEIDWDTSALTELERYNLYAIAYDVNDHDAQSDKIRVTARAEHCFNGSIDEDETAEDCGGNDCGACGGDSCDSDDCQSGVCTEGVCVDAPEITGISPGSGAVGTYVTVSGNNFGSSRGTLLFGSTEADLADCDDAWSNDQVIVVVPSTFAAGEDYTITIVTADGYTDTTQDDNGTLVDDFEVNDTVHPGLCSLNPDSGLVGDIVTFTGVNFGSTQSSSVATFGDSEADAYSEWSDTKLKATVPTLTADDYSTAVYVGGEVSNEIDFTVEDEDAGQQPTISLLDPDSGSEGEYVTISGGAFGSSIGLVYFTNNNAQSSDYGLATVADVDFPAACEDGYWSRDQIIVKVPEGLEATSYLVSVTRQDDATSNTADFTVTSGTAGPGVCSLEPTAGPAGYEGVTLSGERFGQTDGTVTFFDEQSAEVTSWSDGEVVVTVPDEAATGAVTLTDDDDTDSNATNFEVGDCNTEDLCDANTQQCCSTGACVSVDSSCPEETSIAAEYVWEFSTGIIPTVPTLQVGCSDDMISPTPWDGRNGGDSVCVNAGISGTFDVDMNEDTYVLNDSIVLELCTDTGDDPCATTQVVTLDTLTTTALSFSAYPAGSLSASATYQVTLTSDIASFSSSTSIITTTWTFTTSSDAGDCDIYGVNVTPSSETIEESEETATFNAQALSSDACVILNSADTDWTWATDGTYAALTSDSTCSGAPSACQMAIGLQEGDSYMIAEEDSEGFDDDADLLINFTNPYAVDYWPSCSGGGTACINAAVGAEFNTAMDETSVEAQGNVAIYWCSDESCTSYLENITDTVDLEDADPTMLSISLTHDLEPTQYYKVILSGDIESESDVPLSEYYGGDFSWTFLTRSDSEPCGIGSVVMSPTMATVTYVGATAVFRSVPYSDADDCSVSGERLDPESYSWSWSVDNAAIATLWSDGEVVVADDQVPAGCTAACLPEGTDSYTAICGEDADGDGSDLDPGEDCDDGDATSDDGCSSTCLNEGSTTTCGDNTLDDGEECDDGNTTSRDGCSSTCLNEGSRGGVTTCGDGVVTQSELLNSLGWAGGEDCDGTTGCSSACVNEGSTAVSGIVGVCGDSTVDDPAEQCDDSGTASDDGCDEHCLFEGNATSCGNGSIESSAYESCDDGNTTSGDGCSSRCLLEGSDATRSTPSWCGDAVLDDAEDDECEIDSSSLDSLVEDEQVTVIASTAPGEVEDGLATTAVEAATGGGSGEASLNLTCSCESDNACGEATIDTIGCGQGGCCYERPEILSYTPSSGDACRNTLISLTFDQAMVSGSFDDNIVVTMELQGTETCPYSSTTAFAPSADGFFGKLWFGVSRFVASIVRPALAVNAASDCEMPVTFVSETVTGGQQVSLIYQDLLEEDHDYTVTVTGDPDHTGEGVRSANGVSLNEDYTFDVEVGDDICSFDAVRVTDADEDSSGLFTATNEEHDFTAEAVTVQGGTQEAIVPISGIYDWSWSEGWWSTDDEIVTVPSSGTDGASGSVNVVTATGANGEAVVYGSATITSDTLFEPSTKDDVLYGSADVTANLCVNPWPALPSAAELAAGEGWGAFEDSSSADADPDDDGVSEIAERVAYMNFSTYYCRDAEDVGTSDDYDAADAVAVEDPPSDVLKEYLFTVSGGDAIGIRVASNSDLLSISDWYDEQGFTGSPSQTSVDGYEALTDGRTTYVSAGNVNSASSSGIIYGNIYVISYNEDASDATVAIFNDMLENWSFNTNLDNDRLCYESSGSASVDDDGNTIACTSEFDCGYGDCRADKDKLTRDLTRLTDFGAIQAELEAYGEANGRCSATTATSCTEDDDCDGDETCEPLYPLVDSGSFLRSMTTSAWDSWQSELGADLGDEELATDPLNDYTQCGTEGGTYANYNADTCWYEAPALYACPRGSHVYAYRNVGGTGYSLSTDLEYRYVTGTTEWFADLDPDYTDGLDLMAGLAFLDTNAGYQEDFTCDGTTYGSSVTCGDGVIGSAETCESGDTSTASCTVETCVSTDADYDGLSCDSVDCTDSATCQSTDATTSGTRIVPCNSACTGYETTSDAACVPYRCGNGVIDDSSETCDDGSHNGDYGYCGTSCDWESAFYCGDGTLAGGEVCDEGSTNGVYTASAADSCNATCDSLGQYCGDEVVNGSESCDGVETSTNGLCYGGSDDGEICEDDDDCDSGQCGTESFCTLTSSVSCTGSTDTTSCGSWGTCAVETAAIDDYFCALPPFDPTAPYAITCSGLGDASCSSGTYCSEYASGSFACMIMGPYCGSADAFSTTICPPMFEAVPCGRFIASATYACESDEDTACSGASDITTCQALDSALECTSAGTDYDACGEGTVCLDYDDSGSECTDDTNCDSGDCASGVCSAAADLGETCDDDTDCDADCSTISYQLSRSRSCTSSCTADGAWSDCVSSDDYCGNGSLDGNEECDDGNDSSNDECTNDCTINVCGDGYLYSGEESCDQGDDNGVVCDGLYGKTCRYCSNACVYLTATGAYCGDGEVDADEETCDPGDSGANYYCYNNLTGYIAEACDSSGSTSCADASYTCTQVGICLDGAGDSYCDQSSNNESGWGGYNDCEGNSSTCSDYVCGEDCDSTCPLSYENNAVSSTTPDLYSSDSSSSPNGTTLTIPACTVFTDLSGDISDANLEGQNVNIMFVADNTSSMSTSFDSGSRGTMTRSESMIANQYATAANLAAAYADAGLTARFGLSWFGGRHGSDADGDGVYSESELDEFTFDFSGGGKYFTENISTFESWANTGFSTTTGGVDTSSSTPLYEALKDALAAFESDSNIESSDQNYLVIFTDGRINNSTSELNRVADVYGLVDDETTGTNTGLKDEYAAAVSDLIDEIKDAGITVFNITAFYTNSCDSTQADRWSSMEGTAEDLSCDTYYDQGDFTAASGAAVDYTPDHEDLSEPPLSDYLEVFEGIVNATTGITVTITDADGNEATTSADFEDGVTFDLPSGFACDEIAEQDLTLSAKFAGVGTVTIDNLSLEMCSP